MAQSLTCCFLALWQGVLLASSARTGHLRKASASSAKVRLPAVTRLSHASWSSTGSGWASSDPTPLDAGAFGGPAEEGRGFGPGTEVSSRQLEALLTQKLTPWGTSQGPMASSAASAQERRTKGVLTLLADQFGTEYMGPIGVGSRRGPDGELLPESVLQVIFDTGSADFWVNSDLCRTWPCTRDSRPRFNHSRSETFQMPKEEVNMGTVYGSGEIWGVVGTDDVHLGPFVARKQALGLIREEKGALFSEISMDGLLGLGFASIAVDKSMSPLFDNLVNQHALPSPEFAFYLHPDISVGGAVLWGNIDERLFEGPLVWYPVIEEGWWSLELTAFHIANFTFEATDDKEKAKQGGKWLLRPMLVVDSGTTFLTAMGGVYAAIQQVAKQRNCSDLGSLPPFIYTVKDSQGAHRNISLSPEEYMVKVPSFAGQKGLCTSGVMEFGKDFGSDLVKGKTPLIIGEIFMRHHFTVFRRSPEAGGRAEVGIAKAAKGPEAQAFLREAARAAQSE